MNPAAPRVGLDYFKRGAESVMPTGGTGEPVGISDEENTTICAFAKESHTFLNGQLMEIHRQSTQFWRRYLSRRDDPRDPVKEKWRSHIVVPQAFYNTEAKVAQMVEILFSADPPVQADPVFEDKEATAKDIGRLIEYTQRINHFRRFVAGAMRATGVQGTEFVKNVWKRKTVKVPYRQNQQQVEDFQKAYDEALLVFKLTPDAPPDWQTDPAGFEKWRRLINRANRGVRVPEAPDLTGQPREFVQFWGPYLERVPIWQMFLDPMIQELEDQPVIIHEMYKGASWVQARTGDTPDKPFDPRRVQLGIDSAPGELVANDQQTAAKEMKIPEGVSQNPQFAKPVKIWEVYRLNSEYPFCVILNETQVINKTPRQLPYEHGQAPFGMIRNVLSPGYAYGISDLDPTMTLLDEQDILRSLRLDKVTLYTLPVFQKLQGMGIPDLQKRIAPGGIIEVAKIDQIKELFGGKDVNQGAYAEGDRIGLDVDRSWGIGDNVRGAQSTVGRVSATESTSRLTQALTRLKLLAIQFEDDLSGTVQQQLGLWAQFGDSENRPTQDGMDPMANLDRDKLMSALAANYRFRGATQALNRELLAQQLILFGDKYNALMLPTEGRQLMREVANAMGLRGISKIISTEGDQRKQAEYDAQQAAQLAATKAQEMQARMAIAQMTAPGMVPAGQAQAQGGAPPAAGGPPQPPAGGAEQGGPQ
jgi:hypothetical protein